MGESTSKSPILWFFLVCFIITILLLGWLLRPFIDIIVLGAVTSFVFYPLYRKIYRPPHIGASVASLTSCIIVFLIIFVPIVFFISSLTQQAFGLYQMARDAVLSDQINELLSDTRILDRMNALLAHFNYGVTGEEIKQTVSEIGKSVGLYLYEQARSIAANTLALVVNFVLMLLVVFFLLIDGSRLMAYVIELSPLPTDQEHLLIGKFKEMARAVLVVNGISGVIQGLLGGLAFWLFNFQSAILWGVIMGLLAFLPIVGIGVVITPTVIYLFVKGQGAAAVFFIVFYLVLTVFIEYVLKPKLVGQRVQMHPLLVFFAIIGGLKVYGFLGIIYGPLIVTAFMTMAAIYMANYRRFVESDKETNIDR